MLLLKYSTPNIKHIHLFVCLLVCLSVCLSVCLFIYLLAGFFVYLLVCLFGWLSMWCCENQAECGEIIPPEEPCTAPEDVLDKKCSWSGGTFGGQGRRFLASGRIVIDELSARTRASYDESDFSMFLEVTDEPTRGGACRIPRRKGRRVGPEL
jgi:hypothetical protein